MQPATEEISEKGRLRLSSLVTLQEGFVKSFDGAPISYRSVGKGFPIVCCNGLGVSTFFWVYFERHFRSSCQVVSWDYRGHGKSPFKKNPKTYTIQTMVKDLTAVMNKLKIERAALIGHSLGTQVIFEFYRRHPERVVALLPCFGTYGHVMNTFFNLTFSPLIFRLVYFLGTTFPKQSNLISRLFLSNKLSFWVGGILKVMNTGMINRADSERYIHHVLSVDPLLFTSFLKSAQEVSAEDILHKIKVPTLIVSGEIDQFTPAWISKKMHRLIPDSEFFMMHQASHAGLVEQPDLFNLRIEKFLEERVGVSRNPKKKPLIEPHLINARKTV